MTAPADGGQATVEVGHYNTVDRTPPPMPGLSPGTSVLTVSSLVGITAETRRDDPLHPRRDGTDRVARHAVLRPGEGLAGTGC